MGDRVAWTEHVIPYADTARPRKSSGSAARCRGSVVFEGKADCGGLQHHLVLGVAVSLHSGDLGTAPRANEVQTVTAGGALAAAARSRGVGVLISALNVIGVDDEAGHVDIGLC